MNKINRKVEYALMGLKHMHQKPQGQLTTIKEICAAYGAPFDATSRVMQLLVQRNWLKSEQGAHGGYQVTQDLSKVSFYELIETLLGPVGIAKCLHSPAETCELRETCNILSPMNILNKKLIEFYQGVSVADLITGKASQRPSNSIIREQATEARAAVRDLVF